MKNLTTVSIFIFGVVVTAILTAGLVFYQNKNNQPPNFTGNQNGSGNQSGSTVLDMTEIAKHNSVKSCWLLINNKVYDVTAYFSLHPGGAQTILSSCGQDATEAYSTKDKNPGKDHSSQAYDFLKHYYIGDFNQTAKASASDTENKTEKISSSTDKQIDNKTPIVSKPSNQVVKPKGVILNSAEVAKHNKSSDCWMIISNKVYNVSAAFNSHPGGISPILKYCGQDGTKGFSTKDTSNNHSSYAYGQLASYFLGDLNKEINKTAAVTVKPAPKTPVAINPVQTVNPPTPPVVLPASNIILTTGEVAKHNTARDCWMIISNKVYNVGAAMNSHPGGINAILKYCGQDGTQGFATKDKSSNHSGSAYSSLANYYLGDLNQVVTPQVVQNTAAVTPISAEDEDENEEEFEDD